MSTNGQAIPQSHISTLISKRETTLHKDLYEREVALKDYFEYVIKVICSNMMYDYHDKFLHISFSVSFDKNAAKDAKAEVRHMYYTSVDRDSEDAKTATADVLPCLVAKDTMEYFLTRTMTTHDRIRQDFTVKKLEAYQSNMEVIENEKTTIYQLNVLYILGAQKNKP